LKRHFICTGAATLLAGLGGLAEAQNFCIVRTPGLQGNYVGDCVAGYASGRGRASGVDRYEGSFLNGQPTGQGVYTFADGRRFEGEFLDGKVNGRARFHYVGGDVLDGEFRDNQLFGVGRMTRANGEQLRVQIVNGSVAVVAAEPAAGAAPALAPAGGAAAVVASAQCGDRLRLDVQSLSRQGPGQVQLVVAYENLSNVDLRLQVHHQSSRDDRTQLIDNNGETWPMLPTNEGGARHVQDAVFLPGVKTRASYTFRRVSGGQDASVFILLNPVVMSAAHGSNSGVGGRCRFEVRALPLAAAAGS
jgi:hypothetical protein